MTKGLDIKNLLNRKPYKIITTEEALKDVEPWINFDNETPILYGKEAQKVLKEVQIMPLEKSKENGKKLLDEFDEIININENEEVVLTKEERMSAKADLLYDDDTYIADMYEESENAIK